MTKFYVYYHVCFAVDADNEDEAIEKAEGLGLDSAIDISLEDIQYG